MKSAFSINLSKVRRHCNLTQEQAAAQIGIKRGTLGSYEEGRAEPSIVILAKILEAYEVNDAQAFLSDPNYLIENQNPKIAFDSRFRKLKGPVRQAVLILLGLNMEHGK
jgi:transcriptional regulator with XRE-family HTH domain